MEQEQEKNLKKNSIISLMSLFFQSGYSAVLGLMANLIVTILLSPSIYGIYTILLSMISILKYFSDIGLAAALIQKKTITHKDISTTFTTQQVLIIVLIGILLINTNRIVDFYKLPTDGTYLYWAVLFGFFLSSLKTIPSIFLERKLEFRKIVIVQVVEDTLFYLSVMVCALLGYGLQSFTISVLIRSVVGLILMYSISFWKPQIGFSTKSFKQLITFGVPFQVSSFLALFKDDIVILLLGKIVGLEVLGYIGWAKKWAEAPIRIVMDNIGKVLFPSLARIQDQTSKISFVIEKVLFYQSLIIIPALFGSMILLEPMVHIIPKYTKWAPALPMFYIFAVSSLIVSFGAPFISLLNALGKSKISFMFMILFTSLTWVILPIMLMINTFIGFPITHLIVSVSYMAVVMYVKNHISFDFWQSIYRPLVSGALMSFALLIINFYFPVTSFLFALMVIGLGMVIYVYILKLLFNINIIQITKHIIQQST